MFNKIRQLFLKRRHQQLDAYTRECLVYFGHLFERAARTSGFQYICTILRVEGIKTGYWDAFVEAEEAAHDFSEILRGTRKRGREKRALRMGLFLYCHLTEMSAPYEILANLLRCIQGKPYSMFPFAHLVRIEKNKQSIFAKRHLPSPRSKIEHLRELAIACGEEKLLEIIDGFFRNDVRNAFYHSDYTISEKEFRIAEGGGVGKETINLEDLSDWLARCFAFYSAFTITHDSVRKGLAQGKKFHRWPNYEVIEMLSDEDGLTGFKIHFPNNSHAMFERKKYEGTMGLNFMLEDQGISLMVGDLEKYKNADDWYLNGRPFEEYGARYNQHGFWRPIIFSRDSDIILQKVLKLTSDKIAQGSLFYILATGHAAIEFVAKSKTPVIKGQEVGKLETKDGIELFLCASDASNNYLYDGTVYLKSKNLSDVTAALEQIKQFAETIKKRGIDLKYRLKYQLYGDGSEGRTRDNDDGTFTFTLSMDDPRSTLVANNLGIFPKSDWQIKEEWV